MNSSYVYAYYEKGKPIYIGVGSNNHGALYARAKQIKAHDDFKGRNRDIEVKIIAEALSRAEALTIEKILIAEYSRHFKLENKMRPRVVAGTQYGDSKIFYRVLATFRKEYRKNWDVINYCAICAKGLPKGITLGIPSDISCKVSGNKLVHTPALSKQVYGLCLRYWSKIWPAQRIGAKLVWQLSKGATLTFSEKGFVFVGNGDLRNQYVKLRSFLLDTFRSMPPNRGKYKAIVTAQAPLVYGCVDDEAFPAELHRFLKAIEPMRVVLLTSLRYSVTQPDVVFDV